MPQCKIDSCREPALPTGKRYCAHHTAEYLRKRREYEERQRALPQCLICHFNKVEPYRVEQDLDICRDCQETLDEENRQYEEEHQRNTDLENCTSVQDLKDWITEWVKFDD